MISPPPTMCGANQASAPTNAPIKSPRISGRQRVKPSTNAQVLIISRLYATPASPARIPNRANIGPVQEPGSGSSATWKSGCCPSNNEATAMAEQEVPSAAMAIRVSNRRTSSSSTKTAPAMGALKATASPAPAPAANRAIRSEVGSRKVLPQNWARLAPICTLGPSRPRAKPPPIANRPPTNFTGSNSNGAAGNLPSITASTWGMPLPAAGCPERWTSQAAAAVAAATVAHTRKKPITGHWCAQVIVSVRAVFRCSRATRKHPTTRPIEAPVRSDRRASFDRLNFPLPLSWTSSGSVTIAVTSLGIAPMVFQYFATRTEYA